MAEQEDPNIASIVLANGQSMMLDWDAVAATVPTISQKKVEYGFPIQIQMEDLAELGEVVYLDAEPAQAVNPDGSGNVTDGMFVTVADPGTRQTYNVFIGGVALVRDLRFARETKAFPFRGSIHRAGKGKGFPWLWDDDGKGDA